MLAPRLLALAAVAAWIAACGGPAPLRHSHAVASSDSAGSPGGKPSLANREAEAALAPIMVPLPLPTFPGRFEPVAVPVGMPRIASVAGLSASDVWLISVSGTVMHWNGARTTRLERPQCWVDSCCGRLFDCKRSPSKCTAAAAAKCTMGRSDCAWEVTMDHVRIEGGRVVASTSIDTGGITQSSVESRRQPDGRWSCEQPGQDGMFRAESTRVLPSVTLEAPVVFGPNRLGEYNLLVDGRRLALPDAALLESRSHQVGLAARAPDDLWLWATGEKGGHIWRGNGQAWYPVSVGAGLSDMWLGGSRGVWALVAPDEGDAAVLLDVQEGTAPRGFAVPGATRRMGGESGAFWLVGEKALYHWNGRDLSTLEPPIDIEEPYEQVWLDRSGELWVVGGDRTAQVSTPDGSVPAGVAFRLAPREVIP